MQLACWLIWLTGAYPVVRAWQANRRTSLLHAVSWMVLAWAAWGVALALAGGWPSDLATRSCYTALCITGCAGIAVLGARRPGAGAWNFVVVGLLAVNLLPLAEGLLTGTALKLGVFRTLCLAASLGVGILNYLPTRMVPAAVLLLCACGAELAALLLLPFGDNRDISLVAMGWLALAYTPWAAYWSIRRRKTARSEIDSLWLDFRDRFGFVWAARLRDQFMRSAVHAGLPVVLRWQGFQFQSASSPLDAGLQAEIETTLRALMKRFDL